MTRHLIAVPDQDELVRAGIAFEIDKLMAADILAGNVLWNPINDEFSGTNSISTEARAEYARSWNHALTTSVLAPSAAPAGVVLLLDVAHVRITEYQSVGYSIHHGWACTCATWAALAEGPHTPTHNLWCCLRDHADCCLHIALVSTLARADDPPQAIAEALDPGVIADLRAHAESNGW